MGRGTVEKEKFNGSLAELSLSMWLWVTFILKVVLCKSLVLPHSSSLLAVCLCNLYANKTRQCKHMKAYEMDVVVMEAMC